MAGIGLAYKTPEQQSASNFDAGARAVTQPPAAPGIGMATVPPDVDPNLSPAIPGVVDAQGVPTAPPPQAAPAPMSANDPNAPLIDFDKNPIGSIGLLLSAAGAGLEGKANPVDQMRKDRLEQQAQQYKTAALAMDIVDKTSKFVSKMPADQRKHAIADLDSRFSGALGGHSIAPFLTAITAGNEAEAAARMEALKSMNVSPQMMAYFSRDPDAAVKFIDSYNTHQASRDTPGQKKEDAKAVAEGTNEAGAGKPMTPAEITANKISAENAATSAGSLAESKRHNAAEEAAAGNKPLTADQANSATFADRAHEAETVLSKFGHVLASAKGRVLDNVPGGNAAQSADYQKASQAKTNFLMAVLRKESGAAIGKDEIATGDKQYFPQYGDTQATINQKAENRATARAGLERSAGPNYKPPAAVIHYGADGKPL